MKYKFEQFNVEIENPTVTIQNVNDNLQSKTCSVDVLLTTDSASFGVTIDGFSYVDTWEDSDIEAFVIEKLVTFEV